MQRLQSFPKKDPRNVQKLRREANAAPSGSDLHVAFALALIGAGCTYEAASILRPLRSRWTSSKSSQFAREAIDVQAWWNKNWREFVRLKYSGKKTAALAFLGDRVVHFWDMPPVLVHLGEIAAGDDDLELASHLFHRVAYLAERGLPKMNMEAFAYVSQAALVDILCKTGDAAAALDRHRAIIANPGNAMAHEMQDARLLVAAGHFDQAMRKAASILVIARQHRSGYSKDMRMDFIEASPDLTPLRKRADWKILLRDPVEYLRRTRK